MKKIIFIKGLISGTEWEMFQKLANAMSAEAWGRDAQGYAIPGQVTDPDIIVMLNGVFEPHYLNLWGITSNPIIVQYLMGQTRKANGWAYWDGRMMEHSNYFFGYGDMVQSEDVTVNWLPLPIDVAELPQRNVLSEIKFCTAQNPLSMWKKTYKVKPFLKELGYTLDYITGLSRPEAIVKLKDYNIYVANFNYGNLGKAELEAMTMGLASVGWLKDSVKAKYELLGANFPFVQANSDVFKTTIQNMTLAQINNRGQASRTWMLNNYSLQALANYWRTTLEALT